MSSEAFRVLARLAHLLDDAGVPYAVGGSFASSLYGPPRATQDIDLLIDVVPAQVDRLAAALAQDFYVNADEIRDAAGQRSAFNVLHIATMFKVDLFFPGNDSWAKEELARVRVERVDTPAGAVSVRFSSPEDTVLHKLVWYKLGNEVSERQWSDIAGILKVQGESLDFVYLERWAVELEVAELLARARRSK